MLLWAQRESKRMRATNKRIVGTGALLLALPIGWVGGGGTMSKATHLHCARRKSRVNDLKCPRGEIEARESQLRADSLIGQWRVADSRANAARGHWRRNPWPGQMSAVL